MTLKKKIVKTIIIPFIVLMIGAIYSQLVPQSTTPRAEQLSPTPQVRGAYSQTAKVIEVIDGDTFKIETGDKVRMIGIDTPELHHPKKAVQCFGKEAMDKTKKLIEGKIVRLEKDVSETDRYDRLLRYVYLSEGTTSATPSAELFINEYLVKEGFAHAVTFPPDVSKATLFKTLENQAMTQGKGLWTFCR